jgi:hypothetical protein
VVTFGLDHIEAQNRKDWAFLVLDLFKNIQGNFFNDYLSIMTVQSVVFCTVNRFWSAVEYSKKHSRYFRLPNIGLV